MNNEQSKTATPDRKYVDVGEATEVIHWCHELRCSESQLRDAVSRVGTMAVRVRAFLGRDLM